MELSRFKIFSEFQYNNFLTDIQITLINGTIKAHKLVLAASSEFFKALLNSEVCKEVSTGIINLPSVDYDVFNYIFDYIYMRTPKTELNQRLSFYVDVVEASDFLRMLDIIKMIDSKIADQFSFLDLCKEFDRIFSFPLLKTKLKVQNQFMDCINCGNYSDLLLLPASVLLKVFDIENFTVDENLFWEFLSSYFNNGFNTIDVDFRQKLIDSIRPGLLDNSHLECFYQFMDKYNYSWSNKTSEELRMILSALPEERIRNMNFYSLQTLKDSNEENLLIRTRSIPYLFVSEVGLNNSLSVTKFSLKNLQRETELLLEINSDNFLWHSFRNHLVFLNKHWDLRGNLGIIVNLANYNYRLIPHWQYQMGDIDDDYYKFWGFSLALSDADLYLFGGCYFTHANLTVPSNRIVRFNFIDNKWKIVSNLHLKVACWSSSAVKDVRRNAVFYISGGRSPKKYLKSFYAVDIESNSVIDYPNLPFSISGHSMEMVKNFIAVYGGAWDGSVRHEILLFDLSSSLWHVVKLTNIADSVHIDYCCDTAGDGGDDDKISFYDLRTYDKNRLVIYSHRVDINSDQSEMSAHSSQLVLSDLQCARPLNIMLVRSLTLPHQTMKITENIFNNPM